jgi:hypothetical protein
VIGQAVTLSSFQHSGNTLPTEVPGEAGMCQNPANPNYHGPTVRALLLRLGGWADRGIASPDSRYGSATDGTLVSGTCPG